MKKNAHKIGAVSYALWGILHIIIGGMLLFELSLNGGTAALSAIATAIPREELPQNLTGPATGVLAQHAWNLLWFGAFGLIVGATMNWKNSRVGYWFNLVVVSAADVGFIVAILIPGYITFADGVMGPILWMVALVFSTLGIRSGEATGEMK